MQRRDIQRRSFVPAYHLVTTMLSPAVRKKVRITRREIANGVEQKAIWTSAETAMHAIGSWASRLIMIFIGVCKRLIEEVL